MSAAGASVTSGVNAMRWLCCLPLLLLLPPTWLLQAQGKSLPVIDTGVFIIQGTSSCHGGAGYCMLGNDCTEDIDFTATSSDQHCDGLVDAFSPSVHFTCCKFNALGKATSEEPTTVISSVTVTDVEQFLQEEIPILEHQETNEIPEGADISSLIEIVGVVTDMTGVLGLITEKYSGTIPSMTTAPPTPTPASIITTTPATPVATTATTAAATAAVATTATAAAATTATTTAEAATTATAAAATTATTTAAAAATATAAAATATAAAATTADLQTTSNSSHASISLLGFLNRLRVTKTDIPTTSSTSTSSTSTSSTSTSSTATSTSDRVTPAPVTTIASVEVNSVTVTAATEVPHTVGTTTTTTTSTPSTDTDSMGAAVVGQAAAALGAIDPPANSQDAGTSIKISR